MIVALVVVMCFLTKVWLIGQSFRHDDSLSYLSVFVADLPYILLCTFLLLISGMVRSAPLRAVMRLVSFLMFALFLTDMALIFTLQSRLYFTDIPRFAAELGTVFSGQPVWLMGLMVVGVLFLLAFLRSRQASKTSVRVAGAMLVVSILLGAAYTGNETVKVVFYRNFVAVNLADTHRHPYSPAFVQRFDFQPQQQCRPQTPDRPDSVYILMVESWSDYHSALFGGGDNDWTPELDALARQNIRLSQFYANGFTTEMGLYALVTGLPPVLYQQEMQLDGGVRLSGLRAPVSEVARLEALGYHSVFVTSGDLGFLGKGEWLRAMGFSELIGADSFSGEHPRYLFNSVDDRVLFEHAAQMVREAPRPRLMVVENVTTHPPFYVPGKGGAVLSEEAVFRYTDREIARFIREVTTPDDLVIVFSDHRAMTAVSPAERRRAGEWAVARIPAFMIWKGRQRVTDLPLQQSDILHSIAGLIEGEQCVDELSGNLFPTDSARASQCVVHSRGDDRSLVNVRCNGQNYQVRLDGDQTRVTKGPDDPLATDVVNFLRLIQAD